MKKDTYYVTLHGGPAPGEIRQVRDDNDAYYDFELQATKEEITQLQNLLDELGSHDMEGFNESHLPLLSTTAEEANRKYQESLNAVYQKIYELGTTKTKQQIKELGILEV